ncbi:DUF5988 family protein [Streptomyces sp. NPDC016845]|uniref:DUF5988 family protein n=1 Tax=Streptomyces sp. NPDC016845 TaxID=3364972 RepID=UPI0037A97921
MPMMTAEPNALLIGMPYQPREKEIVTFVRDHHETFKLRVENRYDHFSPTEEFVRRGDSELRVFRYAQHTWVAE